MTITITPRSMDLFLELANNAGNWAGEPLFEGNAADKGNLTQLKQAGLVETFVDGGCSFVIFTAEGRKLAMENGIDLLRFI